MGCGEFLVKYILFFVNLFFALGGLALLGVGVAVQLQVSAVLDIFDSNFDVAPILSMVVGGVVFLIAFFGCCGAIRESNCMLVVYSIFMIILMIVKITLSALVFVNLKSVETAIPQWLNQAFTSQANSTAFHDIETAFKCCGTTGALSYGVNIVSLPASCCAADSCNITNAYPGCNDVLIEFFHTFGLVIGLMAITIVAFELVAVVFSLCLANHARNKNRRSRY